MNMSKYFSASDTVYSKTCESIDTVKDLYKMYNLYSVEVAVP